jgi:predicted CopG family antitoxin
MVNINISLKEEAYNYLKMLKGNDKSFSDVVIELKNNSNKKGNKEEIMKFFGCLKDKNIDWNEKEKNMKKFRDGFNKNLRERLNDRVRH